MKVTLRKFLEITGKNIIHEWLCIVYVEEYDEVYKEYFSKPAFAKKGSHEVGYVKDIKNLDPYMDYEIYKFDQEWSYGEVDTQYMYLRKIKED